MEPPEMPPRPPSPLLSIPDDRSSRWALLSSLIAEWYRPLSGGDGFPIAALDACEKRLSTRLPAAMREWYGLAGRREDVWNCQDTLLSPDELIVEGGVLQFYVENQAVTSWGMRSDNLNLPDAPVVVRNEQRLWVVQSSRLSEFALHMFACIFQFGHHSAQIRGYAPQSCVDRIVSQLPKLAFPEFVRTHARLFGFADLLVSVDGADHVSASARGPEGIATFRTLIDGSDFEILQETDDFA